MQRVALVEWVSRLQTEGGAWDHARISEERGLAAVSVTERAAAGTRVGVRGTMRPLRRAQGARKHWRSACVNHPSILGSRLHNGGVG